MNEAKLPNPIYERFTRGSHWPNLRQSRWLAVGLVLACTVLQVWLPSVTLYRRFIHVLFLPIGLVAISPVLFSVYAVNLTYRLTRHTDYQMVRLTPLSDDDVMEGFTQVALSRLRLLRVIVTGVVLVIGLLFILDPLNQSNQSGDNELIIMAVINIVYVFAVWIAQWICVLFGVNLAIQCSSRWEAILSATLMALTLLVALYMLSLFAALILMLLATFLAMRIN